MVEGSTYVQPIDTKAPVINILATPDTGRGQDHLEHDEASDEAW